MVNMDSMVTADTGMVGMINNSEFDLVDFHSHILPRADHGSDSLNMSIKQLSLAKSAGVTRIIVTPHFYPQSHTVEGFLKKRNASFKRLNPSLQGDMPEIRLGAEVLLCENLHKMEGIKELCVFGTDTILIELPFSEHSICHVDSVAELIKSGLGVVIAHAERYDKSIIEEYISIGARLQLNASVLNKIMKPKHILDWIERGFVIALGSDIHRVDKKAYNHFRKGKFKLANDIIYIKEKSDAIWNCSKKLI